MFQGLRSLILPVADLAAAKTWYADVLGVAPYFDEPFYVGFDVAGYELGLHPAGAAPDVPGHAGGTAYLGCADVAVSLARLVDRGAHVGHPPQDVGGGIVTATVVDPFGNKLGLIANPHFRVPALGSITVSEPPGTLVSVGRGLAEREVRCSVTVPMTPLAVWSLWTTPAQVARWLVPESRIELRIGGKFELDFLDDQPPGQRGSEGCRVLSFLPGRMLSFTWNAPPHLPATRELRTFVVVTFEAMDGGTRVEIVHLGWPAQGWEEDGGQWPATVAYFERAWGMLLAALAAHGQGLGVGT